MHILYVHQNFPAQFGHIGNWLSERLGWRVTFVSELPEGTFDGIQRIQFKRRGGARNTTHFTSRSLENYAWASHAVYEACLEKLDSAPDLIVGHSGFGSTCFLADLFDAPIINFFEWFYRPLDDEVAFRPDYPSTEQHLLRSRIRNAAMLLDLQSCERGYSPTEFQRTRFPSEYLPKIDRLFDGIDTDFWYPQRPIAGKSRWVGSRRIPPETKIVTYVSRGFESMRGFDIFMRVAKRICDARKDVVFLCVGSDRHCYGGDERFTGGKPFREWVLSQGDYDLTRFIFTGSVQRLELVRLLGLSDLHIYLTVPFVLSWSLFNSLACGCTVLGSNTPPVAEVIDHEVNGLLADFYDVEGLSDQALRVLRDPEAFRPLGRAGIELILSQYSMEAIMPRMLQLYNDTMDQYRLSRNGRQFHAPQAWNDRQRNAVAPERPTSLVYSQGASEVMAAMDAPEDDVDLHESNGHSDNGSLPKKQLRVLLTIAHYYRASKDGRYGSLRDSRATRLSAIRDSIANWHLLFSGKQRMSCLARPEESEANGSFYCKLDVVICTLRDHHLLGDLGLPPGSWRCARRNAAPLELGFECQDVLREQLGNYDYYCYQEDDLIPHDPLWFHKLAWFNQCAGDECLLQPNRFEGSTDQGFRKTYIDGDLPLEKTLPYQDIGDQRQLNMDAFGTRVRFLRPMNPHAGCYFLTESQLDRWTRKPYFLDRASKFYSPLESAATLGIMRTFRIYKPAPECASFFEIEHAGDAWTRKLDARAADARSSLS